MSAEGTRTYTQGFEEVYEQCKNAALTTKMKIKETDPSRGYIRCSGKSDIRTMMGEKVKINVSQMPNGTQVHIKAKMEGMAITSMGKTDETVRKFFTALDSALGAGGGAQAGGSNCASCGKPLTYVQEYQRWYCYGCQKYA